MDSEKPLQILLVEDSPVDAALLQENILLSGSENVSVSLAASMSEAVDYLKDNHVGAILLDLTLPDSFGLNTVQSMMTVCDDAAIVVLTGVDDENIGAEAVRMGVQDYLVKGQVDGKIIMRAIRYAMERKQAQRQILLANERLQYLLIETSAVIYTSKVSGGYGNTFISENVTRMTGFQAQEFTEGKDFWLEHIHPDDKKHVLASLPKVFKEPYLLLEYQLLCSTGTYIWIRDEMRVVRDRHGKPLEIIGCMIDITDRKRMEAELHTRGVELEMQNEHLRKAQIELEESRHRYTDLFDFAPTGYFVFDKDGAIVNVNLTGATMLGLERGSLINKQFFTFVHNDSRSNFNSHHQQIFAGAEKSAYEIKLIKKGGTCLQSQLISEPVKDSSGRIIQCRTAVVDITERKKIEETLQKAHDELEERVKERTTELADALVTLQDQMEEVTKMQNALMASEIKYRELVENANSIILRRDADGIITFFNEFAQKLFGFSEKEIIGRNIVGTIVPKVDSAGRDMKNVIEDISKNPQAYQNYESENLRKDGSRVWISWTIKPIKDEYGNVDEILSVGNDVTYRKQTEAKIHEHQAQLRSLTTELLLTEERERHNVAEALHDSIGPLLAFSERELGNLEKFATKEIALSLAEVKHHLGDAVKLTRSLTFDLSPTSLYDLGFEAAVEELTEQFAIERKFKFSFKAPEEPIPLSDEIKILLYRSVRELLVNIAKHASPKTVWVTLNKLDGNIEIVIQDNGKGFDAASQPKSKGFGLFSIRERLKHIGGQFLIESQKGKGTKVTLLAPMNLAKDE